MALPDAEYPYASDAVHSASGIGLEDAASRRSERGTTGESSRSSLATPLFFLFMPGVTDASINSSIHSINSSALLRAAVVHDVVFVVCSSMG